jgi:5-methylthioribose kinase
MTNLTVIIGPIGFDTGAFLGNLLLAYVSQAGHKNGEGYGEWILEQVVVFWKTFEAQFIQLWNDPTEHTGFLFGRAILNSDTVHAQDDFLQSLFIDTLSFAGMKMLRRIVGIAHVEDLESIEDKDVRAQCERHGLEIAKTFIKSAASSFTSVEQVIQLARTLRPN